MRPEVEAMPWGSLDLSQVTAEQLLTARKAWTGSAYQEHRTGAACALTLQALIEARAPLDLIAVASRFPLDEMVHVELCARMAMEFGGGTEIIHDPKAMVVGCDASLSPLLQAADLVVRFFCVGEAISIPLLRATWHVAKHPLPKAVLGRIVKDEAAHGVFGFTFLDWACPRFSDDEKARLVSPPISPFASCTTNGSISTRTATTHGPPTTSSVGCKPAPTSSLPAARCRTW
ncbi:MAG: ferritin-like domain-containing protein [Pseudomonadota bacterium]